jgi:prolyl-tRNA synthetase
MGTSHNLGQGFAKAFGIKFLGDDEKQHIPWQNSWGFSTRLIGALIMVHGDDKGLVLPPNAAPVQIVIVPILFKKDNENVLKKANDAKSQLKKYDVIVDERQEYTAGWKFNEWELKGVPLRIEIGPKDVENGQVVLVRRDTGEKKTVEDSHITRAVKEIFEDIHHNLLTRAKKHLEASIVEAGSMDELVDAVRKKKLARAKFCGAIECEDWIKDKSGGATSRCIDTEAKEVSGRCVHCGKAANFVVYFSRSY